MEESALHRAPKNLWFSYSSYIQLIRCLIHARPTTLAWMTAEARAMMERRIDDLLHAAEDSARFNDFLEVMAGEPVASSGPPAAVAKQIEEHLLVALVSQDPEPLADAIVLLRRLIARLQKPSGASS